LTFQYPCSPLAEGGEGAGVGGSKLLAAFVKFGAAIDIISGQPQGLPLRRCGQPQGLPLRRCGDATLVGAGLVPAPSAC
jgi:hypothetical protein